MPKMDLKKLEQYLMTFSLDRNAERQYTEQYKAFYDSVFMLAGILESYADPSLKKNMTALRVADTYKLRKAYEDVLIKANAFKAAAGAEDLDEQPELSGRIALIDSFCEYISEDMTSLSNVADAKGKTIDDIFDDARAYTIDITGQNLSKAGASMSSRIPVSFEDKSGKTLTGFFTPETKVSMDEETINMFSEAKKDHPEYDLALRVIISDFRFEGYTQDIENVAVTVNTYLQGDDILEVYNEIVKDILEENADQRGDLSEDDYKKYIASLSTDREFSMRVLNMMNAYAQIKNRNNVYESVGIVSGSVVEQRNAAMSVLGDLTGTSHVLARSVQMSILNNGNKTNGVFMEFADGSDLIHMKENDPLKDVTYEQIDNPGLLKQLADLQVLDYICGNTDRHAGNMFYRFEETENGRILSGIVGIDNDNSFGKNEMSSTCGLMQLPGINSLMVINENTAARIKGLSLPMVMVALKNYSLSKEEIAAAWDRVTSLQAKIIEGEEYYKNNPNAKPEPPYIKTVSEAEWNTLTLKDLSVRAASDSAPERPYNNYFAKISTLPGVVADQIQREKKEKEVKAVIEAKHPELKKDGGAGFRMAKGEVLLETNMAGIDYNNSRLTGFDATMKAVNKGFFISSSTFDKVIDAFREVRKLSSGMNEGVSNDYLEKLNDAYITLNTRLTAYLDKKNREKEQKTAAGKTTSYVFESRVEFTSDLQSFVGDRIDGIGNELARTKTAEYFDSASMSVKFSNYVRNRIARQNDSMFKEISALNRDDPYSGIKARAVNARNTLMDHLLDAPVPGGQNSIKYAVGELLILQTVDSLRQKNGAGGKEELAIENAGWEKYSQIINAVTEIPSVKNAIQKMNKQLIKEFLLDNKAKRIISGIPKAERRQFNERITDIINAVPNAGARQNAPEEAAPNDPSVS